jgi:hypothetical protein
VVDAVAVATARGDQFARVVAASATDDDDGIALAGQRLGGLLAVLGWTADGVDDAQFGPGEASGETGGQSPDSGDRLGGLGGDTEAGPFGEGIDVGLGEHHVEHVEVPDQTADLDMVALADNDGVPARRGQVEDGLMGVADERAGGFVNFEAAAAQVGEGAVGGAVGGDEDGGRAEFGWGLGGLEAAAAEAVEDGGVMDEVTEGGEGPWGRGLEGEVEGMTDAEAETEVGSVEDLHRLCIAKLQASTGPGPSPFKS